MDHIVTYVSPTPNEKNDWDSVPDDIGRHLRAPGHPRGRAQLPSPASARSTTPSLSTTTCRTPPPRWASCTPVSRRPCRSPEWEEIIRSKLMTLIPAAPTTSSRRCNGAVVRRLLLSTCRRRQAGLPAAELLPPQRQGRRPVRAHHQNDNDADLHFIEGCPAPANVANLHAGAVELFVGKRAAYATFSTIENWSKNMYNLNTKRARCERGRHRGIRLLRQPRGLLYLMSVLAGRKSCSSFTGITFAAPARTRHGLQGRSARRTPPPRSRLGADLRGGGISTFRSSIVATPAAEGARCASVSASPRARRSSQA